MEIIVAAVILVIILLVFAYASKQKGRATAPAPGIIPATPGPAPASGSAAAPAAEAPAAPTNTNAAKACELDCTNAAVWDKIKYFYANYGPSRHEYVMKPTAGKNATAESCDISFEYRPKGNPNQALPTGTDRRIFSMIDFDQDCNWVALAMGNDTVESMF